MRERESTVKIKPFQQIPLSWMTIQRRVENVAKDANEYDRMVGYSYFSVALNDSGDTETVQLLVYVRAVIIILR